MALIADITGYAAACFTTFSLLPQIIRILRLRDSRDVSIFMPIMVGVGSALWVVYGLFIGSMPVKAANTVSLILAVLTVVFAARYRTGRSGD